MTQPPLAADDRAARLADHQNRTGPAAAATPPCGSARKAAQNEPLWLPTPDEIRETCRAIRDEWDHQERRRRWAGLGQQRWEVPGLNHGAVVTLREYVALHD